MPCFIMIVFISAKIVQGERKSKTHLRDLFDKTNFNDVKELDYPYFEGLFD